MPTARSRLAVTGTAVDEGLLDALAGASFMVIGRLTRLAAEEDLSLTQLRMLAILRDRTARMAELAEALGVDRSSATGLITRAQQRGLVDRTAAEGDGRGILVHLTDEGRSFTQHLTGRIASALGDLTVRLDPYQRAALLEGLTLLNEDRQ